MNLATIIENDHPTDVDDYHPYLIAEIGVNHEGSLDLARRQIFEAAEGGANAAKFQSYKAERLASKYSPSYWDLNLEPTTSQYALFKKYDSFNKEEFERLRRYCEDAGIDFLSTPFDLDSAKFLNDLVPVFKISSSDLNNLPFIEGVCDYGKPIILSTGASYLWEIEESVGWIKDSGCPLALLHCVLNYPTSDNLANLSRIAVLRKTFTNCVIGYSDHTLPKNMDTLYAAVMLGAKIIEKHFTHDKNLPGNDHYHAMNKDDLIRLKGRLAKFHEILGNQSTDPIPEEMVARKNARRSLVSSRKIKAGEILRLEDITCKRPGLGIDPRQYKDILGKKVVVDIPEDTTFEWEQFH
jgi:N-acetylneuraminate synthase